MAAGCFSFDGNADAAGGNSSCEGHQPGNSTKDDVKLVKNYNVQQQCAIRKQRQTVKFYNGAEKTMSVIFEQCNCFFSGVYLCGHSAGGQLAVMTQAVDGTKYDVDAKLIKGAKSKLFQDAWIIMILTK